MSGANALQELVAAASADLDDPRRNRMTRPRGGETVPSELYHAGLSICFYKVRTLLAEKREPYTSREMVIVAGHGVYAEDFKPAENYRPSYVQLEMSEGTQLRKSYAEQQSGPFLGRD